VAGVDEPVQEWLGDDGVGRRQLRLICRRGSAWPARLRSPAHWRPARSRRPGPVGASPVTALLAHRPGQRRRPVRPPGHAQHAHHPLAGGTPGYDSALRPTAVQTIQPCAAPTTGDRLRRAVLVLRYYEDLPDARIASWWGARRARSAVRPPAGWPPSGPLLEPEGVHQGATRQRWGPAARAAARPLVVTSTMARRAIAGAARGEAATAGSRSRRRGGGRRHRGRSRFHAAGRARQLAGKVARRPADGSRTGVAARGRWLFSLAGSGDANRTAEYSGGRVGGLPRQHLSGPDKIPHDNGGAGSLPRSGRARGTWPIHGGHRANCSRCAGPGIGRWPAGKRQVGLAVPRKQLETHGQHIAHVRAHAGPFRWSAAGRPRRASWPPPRRRSRVRHPSRARHLGPELPTGPKTSASSRHAVRHAAGPHAVLRSHLTAATAGMASRRHDSELPGYKGQKAAS